MKESLMKYSGKLAAFKQFAEERGHKVESQAVIFDEDDAAAKEFEALAVEAGLDVSRDTFTGGWDGSPIYWLVRLNA
jgi:hypothetical protein